MRAGTLPLPRHNFQVVCVTTTQLLQHITHTSYLNITKHDNPLFQNHDLVLGSYA